MGEGSLGKRRHLLIYSLSGKQYPRRSRSDPLGSPGVGTHLPRDASLPRVGCWQAVPAGWIREIMSHLRAVRAWAASVRSKWRGTELSSRNWPRTFHGTVCMLESVVSALCYLSLALNKFPIWETNLQLGLNESSVKWYQNNEFIADKYLLNKWMAERIYYIKLTWRIGKAVIDCALQLSEVVLWPGLST